jgi:hypothetical protein
VRTWYQSFVYSRRQMYKSGPLASIMGGLGVDSRLLLCLVAAAFAFLGAPYFGISWGGRALPLPDQAPVSEREAAVPQSRQEAPRSARRSLPREEAKEPAENPRPGTVNADRAKGPDPFAEIEDLLKNQ